jgi:hypothetical protein
MGKLNFYQKNLQRFRNLKTQKDVYETSVLPKMNLTYNISLTGLAAAVKSVENFVNNLSPKGRFNLLFLTFYQLKHTVLLELRYRYF